MKRILISFILFYSFGHAGPHYFGSPSQKLRDLMEKICNEVTSDKVPRRSPHILFHGSPSSHDRVRPRYLEKVDEDGVLYWRGKAVFAAYDYRISLFYTHNKVDGFYADIDLAEYKIEHDPIIYDIIGGNSLEEALNLLFGKKDEESIGYIYLLDATKFYPERELGLMEVVSRDLRTGLGRFEVNRRHAVDLLVEKGLVELSWERQKKPSEIQTSIDCKSFQSERMVKKVGH